MEIIKRRKTNKLLVIGGTGFIGQHVVKKALELNFKVTVICKNKPKIILYFSIII